MSSKRAWRRSWFGCREFVPREFQGVPVQGNIVPDCVPSCEHRTVRFVREIAEGCDTFDTTLWQSIEAGEVIRRWLGGVPVVINRRPAFARYAEIVKKSLDYADTHGILPCAAKLDPAPPGSHPDVDIGIAIIGQHGMVKYRKGKHRFAYALALGIPVIPCRCYFAEARAIDDLEHIQVFSIPGEGFPNHANGASPLSSTDGGDHGAGLQPRLA